MLHRGLEAVRSATAAALAAAQPPAPQPQHDDDDVLVAAVPELNDELSDRGANSG